MLTAQPDVRLAAMRRYEILDAPADGSFDRVARLAALIFDVPIATVTIVDEHRVWFAAAQGLDGVTEIGNEPGLCAWVEPREVSERQIALLTELAGVIDVRLNAIRADAYLRR